MIRYRTRETTRSLYPVTVETFGKGGYCLMLPVESTVLSNADKDYRCSYDCDDILTPHKEHFAGDHECFHTKVDATIEGKVILNGKYEKKSLGFGQYSGVYSSNNQDYTWVCSSGSGPSYDLYGPASGIVGPIIGPGILAEGSCVQQIVNHNQPWMGPAMFTNYRKVKQIANDTYALIYAQSMSQVDKLGNVADGFINYSVSYFTAVATSTTTWSYERVYVASNRSNDMLIALAFLYNPESYWSVAIAAALKVAARVAQPVATSKRTFQYAALAQRVSSGGVSSSTVTKIAKELRKYADNAINSMTPPDVNVWSDLCVSSIQHCQELDINSIAYAKDLIELKQEIKSIKDMVVGYKNPKTYLKAFLESKYGMRLTISDTKKLVSSVQSFCSETRKWNKLYSVVKSVSSDYPSSNYRSCSGFSRTYHYKVYYCPADSRILDCIRTLMNWDAWPTLENDWDLIPLSFTVDWFVGVSDLCDRLDAITYSKYLDVKSVLKSSKLVGDISIDLSKYSIDNVKVKATKYERTWQPNLDLPSFRLDTGSGILTHLPEAFAITALLRH